MRSLILTLIGPDRPGLVESVASAVTASGGNWLESRMAHLGGQFAGILRIEIEERLEEELKTRLGQIEREGLTFVIRSEEQEAAGGTVSSFRLELIAPDQPGIVSAISRVLAARGVNVEAIETRTESAPMSGERLFRANAVLRLPSDEMADTVRDDLQRISGSLMADLTVTAGDSL